jgi:hypothetical protein
MSRDPVTPTFVATAAARVVVGTTTFRQAMDTVISAGPD